MFSILGNLVVLVHLSSRSFETIAESAALLRCKDDDMFIRISDDGSRECVHCSVCPEGFQVKTDCTQDSDTVCEQCPSGSYNNGIGSRCSVCSKCMAGEYIRHNCSRTINTVCSSCPNGTFSMFTNSDRCRPCRYCKPHEDIISECNVYRDNQCGECQKDYFRDGSTGECLPCSYCHTDKQYVVVNECFRKNGHSKYVCTPTNYVPEMQPSTQYVTTLDDTNTYESNVFKNDSIMLTFGILSVCLFGALVVFCMFVVVQLPAVQRRIRWCRDAEVCGQTDPLLCTYKKDSCFKLFSYCSNSDTLNQKQLTMHEYTVKLCMWICCNAGDTSSPKDESLEKQCRINMVELPESGKMEANPFVTNQTIVEVQSTFRDTMSTTVSITDSGFDDVDDVTIVDGITEEETINKVRKSTKKRSHKTSQKADPSGTTGSMFSNPRYFLISSMTNL